MRASVVQTLAAQASATTDGKMMTRGLKRHVSELESTEIAKMDLLRPVVPRLVFEDVSDSETVASKGEDEADTSSQSILFIDEAGSSASKKD